jgi:hypothetical protein
LENLKRLIGLKNVNLKIHSIRGIFFLVLGVKFWSCSLWRKHFSVVKILIPKRRLNIISEREGQ